MGANLLYLKGGTKDHFMEFLAREFPHLVDKYERLYAGAYAPPDYASTVRALIDMLQEKHQLSRRMRKVNVRHEELEEDLRGPSQAEFKW